MMRIEAGRFRMDKISWKGMFFLGVFVICVEKYFTKCQLLLTLQYYVKFCVQHSIFRHLCHVQETTLMYGTLII